MKRVLIGICMVLPIFVGIGCSSDGDDGFNATGTWNWTRLYTAEICDWGVQVGEVEMGQAVLNQSGTLLVLRDSTGAVYEGTIQGGNISFSFTANGVQANINGTVMGNNRAELTGSFSQGQCRLDFNESWDKVSDALLFFTAPADLDGDGQPWMR